MIDFLNYLINGALSGLLYALIAMGFVVIYRASKHGMLGFSKNILLEGKDKNIGVTVINPSHVATPMTEITVTGSPSLAPLRRGPRTTRCRSSPS